MAVENGLKPIKYKDHRTYDFHRTFGVATLTPSEFNFDTVGIFPNQNGEGLPNACTAYTVTGIASNDDHVNYDDKVFTYEKTKQMMGVSGPVPCDQMTALKSGTVYGVKDKTKTEEEALQNRRAPYFIVRQSLDYFDGLVSAMLTKKGTLSMGTPWLPVFELVGSDGVIPAFAKPQNFNVGHNWEACGVKVINNESRIICKSWQGPSYGDHGYCYFNRQQVNDLLSVTGSGAFAQVKATPEDIKRVEMNIIEVMISYLRMWLSKLTTQPMATPTYSLVNFCLAIQDHEGYYIGSRSYRNKNPGNCKFSSVGYAPKYGTVLKDTDNFAIFKDYETGFLYLKNLVLSKIAKNPNQTILEFFRTYAPATDNNEPDMYAQVVASKIGATVDSQMKNIV